MFGLFTKKPLLDSETTEWIYQTYAWALRNFGSNIFHNETILVTPSNKHFPDTVGNADEMAEKVFCRVKQYAGMMNWECKLRAQNEDTSSLIHPTIAIQGAPRSPAGTFSVVGKHRPEAVITYNPGQVNNPEKFIATCAHELAHYLSIVAIELPPGGKALIEPAIDLTSVFMGFGIFLANTAFTFNQYTTVDSQGWSAQAQGYLSQYELVYSLAIFCVLKNITNSEVTPHLKQSLRSYFRKAVKEVSNNTVEIERLKGIDSLNNRSVKETKHINKPMRRANQPVSRLNKQRNRL